jgi:hypothetical protein
MKKKPTSQSAFFNLRVLIGLFVGMTGLSLALFAANPLSLAPALAQQKQAQQKYKVTTKSSIDPLVPVAIDCSKIRELGIDRQENLRAGAIMIHCGLSEGGKPSPASGFFKLVQNLVAPLVFGGTDVNLITGTETFPNVTQSETFTTANPDDPSQIMVAYNDSRGRNFNPINISGASISTDGGTTFTRLTKANGQSPFDNTFGDPVVLYHKPSGSWVTVWLDAACGGQGLGGYKSTTPADPNSWTHFCAFNEGSADRESGWADNNPASPFFGRLYISWNDFNIGQGALMSIFSTDGGATWSSPATVINGATFIRDVQITGDLAGSGTIYVAGMDEGGGGFPHNDTNLIFKSTDGGNTWANTYTGPSFPGPGVTASGYFACMFTDFGAYWRHEGWGQPAAINNTVHLVYSQHGAGSDPGDVYYIRSTDGGVTFGAPLKLNTDATTRPQWQVNLSVSPAGTLFATWYDARESASCTAGNPGVPCYRMWSRKSNDNGASWLPDDALSDVVTPLPGQPDPGIQPTYAGDYDYGSAVLTKHVTSWTDGRVAISGQSQQDAFTDRELVGFAVTSTDPACGSIINTQPTDFIVNLSDAVVPGTVDASDFTVNGIPANSFSLSNGDTTITFTFNSSPVTTEGEQTMHIPAGAFNRASDNDPVFEFNCTFRYDATLLVVTDTVPPVGGTFTPPAPGDYTFDVNWNEPVDPTSVQTSDLTLTGNVGASVTNVQVINGNMTTEFTVHFSFGGSVTACIAAGAITDAFGNPNEEFCGSYTVEGCPPQNNYDIQQIGGSIEPGDTDIGNHGDDQVTTIPLPFSYTLYDTTFPSINVSSNGNAQFTTSDNFWVNVCLPWLDHNYMIFPYWDDQRTDVNTGCSSFPGGTCGIFTSVTGIAPNRVFNIEWRTVYFRDTTQPVNYELRLYEGQTHFDVIYGTVPFGNTDATAGVQRDNSAFNEYFCLGAGGEATGGQSYMLETCGTPTPTPTITPSVTPTPTATPSVTPSATPTVTPSVTPSPTPTVTPSVTPSATPTVTPSVTPSATPSATPTVTPSVTPTPTATPGGCVFSQGFWKNHSEAWPVTELQLGNVTYTQDQLLAILREPVRGNGLLILAKQEIAAKLNIANGADGSCIQQTLADADALIGDLVIPPIGDGYLRPRDVSPTAGILGDYNEGNSCAPSCDNSSPPPRHPESRQRPQLHPRP